MPKKWTSKEKTKHKKILTELYIRSGLSINDIGKILNINYRTVYDRLKKCNIKTTPQLKSKYRNQRNDILTPVLNNNSAELMGILCGDGHISHFQIIVTLGNKEYEYVKYVVHVMFKVFGVKPKIHKRTAIYLESNKRNKYIDIYLGSTKASTWCIEQGLVQNKTKSSVKLKSWIYSNNEYLKSFIRGYFDTDGSVYLIRYGIQISFTSTSPSLCEALQKALKLLEYRTSLIQKGRLYITKNQDIKRFFEEIRPSNPKHLKRYQKFITMRRSYSGNYT